MLRGTKVSLRARHEADVAVLHAELNDDVAIRSRADTRPWRPAADTASPFAVSEPSADAARFSVVELASDELAGSALLWGIDPHNRRAHLGMSLRPGYRGRGLGTDVVRVLCRYGFETLGLQRLQVETLADNAGMLHAAERVGFVREGLLRRSLWVAGDFADEVLLGLLAAEYDPGRTPGSPPATEDPGEHR
ncbi:GNAT family protein [Actinocatenispora sera]|uniref:GNAT family N-acetyltransferase n=1 Tax=Actinocatenispora sera TaxID=390989 RepID=UPI0033E011D2